MDPTTYAPPPTQQSAHIAQAANPTPTHIPNNHHPPYAEMITAAITALNEKNGSSRVAIVKYIEREYANLPVSHSALLTHHLKRLKNSGQLVMVKHSYRLPRSGDILQAPGNFPPESFPADGDGLPPPSPKQRPGRPPKVRPVIDVPLSVAETGNGVQDQGVSVSVAETGNGVQAQDPGQLGIGPEPMFVSLGLEDGPPVIVAKRRPGRPSKVNGPVGPSATGAGGPKRRPGRQRVRPVNVPLSGNVLSQGGRPKSSRRRFKPRKNVGVDITGGAVEVPIDVAGDRVFAKRRQGRLPRHGAEKPIVVGGMVLGRATEGEPGTAVLVTDPEQLVVFQELKAKLHNFQIKIIEAVSMVKPCLNHEGAISALDAIQELEILAATDFLSDQPQAQEYEAQAEGDRAPAQEHQTQEAQPPFHNLANLF